MKYLPLVWAGLFRRPLRTTLTFLSMSVAFLLFGVLHGVTAGFDSAINAMSDTRLRVQHRMSITRWLPLAQLAQIERVPGITHVSYYGYFGGYYKDPKNQIGGGAIDMKTFFQVWPELELPAEQREAMLHTRTGVVVGAELASKYGWKIGDRVPIGTPIWRRPDGTYNWTFNIVGIYRFKDDSLPANELWMNYDYFTEGGGYNGHVTMYIASIDRPENSARICKAIDALFQNSSDPTRTQNEKDWVRTRIRSAGNIGFMVNSIIGAVLFTLLALTGNTMMQSVRERIPELAVLKTFGYRDGVVTALVLTESVLLCLTAAACGLLIAAAVFPSVFLRLGVGAAPMPASVSAAGAAIAVCLALVSAGVPVWRALKLNIVTALAAH